METARPFAVELMLGVLLGEGAAAAVAGSQVLLAAAWIVGEYRTHVFATARDAPPPLSLGSQGSSDGYWVEGPRGEDRRSRFRRYEQHARGQRLGLVAGTVDGK